MKVLNLQCAHGHGFEGWFGSEQDYQDQSARGLLRCPVCDVDRIEKRPSAPRLNLSSARPAPAGVDARASAARSGSPSAGQGADTAQNTARKGSAGVPATGRPGTLDPAVREGLERLQAAWLDTVREVVARTEDVGERFTEEARRIHYGEAEARGIRGTATAEQRAELAEEGVDVWSLPLPADLKGPRH